MGRSGKETWERVAVVEAMVEDVTSIFPTLHALCVGPGLGRNPIVFSAVARILARAVEANLTLVLDADALFMLSLEEYGSLFARLRGYGRCVMTPNAMETKRLSDAILRSYKTPEQSIVVRKGYVDVVSSWDEINHEMRCEEEGGLKRSGGIGDVLAGSISAFMAWNAILETETIEDDGNRDGNRDDDPAAIETKRREQRIFAAWAACCAVKKATKIAFEQKKRAMSAMDVLEEVGGVVRSMEDELDERTCAGQKHDITNASSR